MAFGQKHVIGAAIVLALVGGGAYAYLDFWRGEQATPSEIVLYGNVDIREADLAFNVAGRIETMRAEEGDEVKKGQLLAILEPQTFEAEVDAAKAAVAVQRETLNKLLAGSRPEEIQEARANARAIEANLVNARADLRRTEALARTQVAALQKLDQDRATVQSLTAQLQAANQNLALVIKGPRDEDIAVARAQLQGGEAALALAQQHLDYTKLFAPEHGVIKTRIMEPGAVVQAQTPVYTLALLDPVWVRTYVPEPHLSEIRPGMKAEVFTDSAPGKPYGGWVGFVSPVAEFTPKSVETPEVRTSLVYRLRVYVRNPDDSLRQGMPVTVRLQLSDRGSKAATGASSEPHP